MTLLTLLGGNEDDTVGGVRTIEGGSRRTGEHVDALDVIGVHGRHGITCLAGTLEDSLGLATLEVIHGYTVDDIEYAVVAGE